MTMTKPNIQTISKAMIDAGMIPVYNHANIETCIQVLRACYDAGLRVFEFTNRGASAKEVFIKLNEYVTANLPEFLLGAGTIMDTTDAKFYIENGAAFIISPFLDVEIGQMANEKNIAWIPGCGTLTEIMQARKAGAEIIKIFPGSVLGPSFVASVLGPVPELKLMPTGGVNPVEKDLREWFQAGVVCVGMGSQLFSKELINSHDFSSLANNIRATKIIIDNIKLELNKKRNVV